MLYGTLVEDSPSAVSDQAKPAATSANPNRALCGERIAYSPAARGTPMIDSSTIPRCAADSPSAVRTTNTTDSTQTADPTIPSTQITPRLTRGVAAAGEGATTREVTRRPARSLPPRWRSPQPRGSG